MNDGGWVNIVLSRVCVDGVDMLTRRYIGGEPTVTPQVLPWLEHTLVLRTMITCGNNLRRT
jgi:hypothetical protein